MIERFLKFMNNKKNKNLQVKAIEEKFVRREK